MVKSARIFGFALIAAVASSAAFGIAAVGKVADVPSPSAAQTIAGSKAFDQPGFGPLYYDVEEIDVHRAAACAVDFMVGDSDVHQVSLELDPNHSLDLDGPVSAGFTISCGVGAGSDAAASAVEADFEAYRGDRL